ncbi:Disease resistance protein UNI [Citrus sinensis]|nr:disease resistance protein UNI-like isoform X1 [Citrus sinensis]XP_052288238.1 disease resistance protein UNI-like isoform X1 [Citrus sinensis]KAH9657198.1 Disease resistance protein UNI [Citrus sinensis]
MEILSGVASKLGELLADATINQARYLFCFNSIIKELGDKETNLKEAQDGINEKVEQDRQKHRAVVVEKDVEKWLADVVKEMANVQNLKAKIDENKSCLNGWCPNWGCRYWLGRKALKKTSKLADLLDRGKFSTVAHPTPLSSNKELPAPRHFMSFETTELACNQIIEALKKESTKMVGLHGLGGVGKTTLAKFAGNQLRQQKIFDDVGIATISRDPNIINVQSELVKSLGWALTEKDEKDRADRLRLMFSESKSRKILIILDDVWNELDLETVGIPVGDRDNCCKILLTTRLQPVCDRMGCDTQIQLGVLKREEGLALLRKHAGIDADSTLIGVSEQIANECKGLPLAIKAVGSALRGKGFGQWKVALHKLKNAKLNTIEGIGKDDQDVYHCLKFSYDNLNGEDSRSCFLLCSLFPEDYEIDSNDLVGYAVALDWYQVESIEEARILVSGTIKELKASSLLLDTGNDRSVKMHDIVRDVSLWIGSVGKKYFTSKVGIGLAERVVEESLEQCKGISLVGNKKEELPTSLVCPNLQILQLQNTVYNYKLKVVTTDGLAERAMEQYEGISFLGYVKEELPSGYDYQFHVPEHFFEGMPALKVVTVIGGVISLKSLQFLTNLQVLQLIQCKVSDASFLGKLKRLQILCVKESPIEIPEELGDQLSRLKLLIFINSGCISPITIKKFPQLEEFYGRIKDWEAEGMSSEENDDGKTLHTDKKIARLPKDFTFPKLQRHHVSNGNKLEFLMQEEDEIFGQRRGLKINNCEATSLGIFSALYQELEILNLRTIIGCHNIVPSIDPRGLNELTCLSVNECKELECIMDASKSPHGKSGNPVMLSRLAELSMWQLPELKWIWKAPAQYVISLQALTELTVCGCNNLTYIFTLSQARSLKQLKSLYVSGCWRMECIVEAKFDHNEGEISVGDGNSMLALPLLTKLTLHNLPKLKSFCSENYCSIWTALEESHLRHCPNLTISSTELEANLQYLEENLKILNVDNCSHLSDTIPALLKHDLKNLEDLKISQLGVHVVFQLEAIIAEGQENKLFPCLKSLQLKNLPELQVLYHEGPTHIFSLQNLTRLLVIRCSKLKRLLSSTLARNLLQLEELSVRKCLELEQIIDEDEDEDHLQPVCFPKLRRITFYNCPKLKHLFHISVAPSLQNLTQLWVESNYELEEVFWHKDGADVTDYNEIVMNGFWNLTLLDLPNLTNFWPAGYQIPAPHGRFLSCPKLRANSEGNR